MQASDQIPMTGPGFDIPTPMVVGLRDSKGKTARFHVPYLAGEPYLSTIDLARAALEDEGHQVTVALACIPGGKTA